MTGTSGRIGRRRFDTNGNGGPTIWVDGRIVGGWAQLRSGEVVPFLLEDVGTEATRRIEAEAAALEAWIGPARHRQADSDGGRPAGEGRP